jgi:glycosyltransferase involved in cell wall biosynthesis
MIYYLSPGNTNTISGGTRKLYDHVAILQNNNFDAMIKYCPDSRVGWHSRDLVVVPEVFGEEILKFPPGVPRLGFCQNGYLVDRWGIPDKSHHPYEHCKDVVGVMVESQHTRDILRSKYQNCCPIILTHSSGNGRNGQPGPFSFGPWPRQKKICYFQYKHEEVNRQIFTDLLLPEGWETLCMTGMSDEQIAETYRTCAIFAAPNFEEGLCAPTQEAMISGTYIVGWYGGGTFEYLKDRAFMVEQGNVTNLRHALAATARAIDLYGGKIFAELCEHRSKWIQKEYSREKEIAELCAIMTKYHGTKDNWTGYARDAGMVSV